MVSDAGFRNFVPLGCPEVRRIVVAIDSYEGLSKKSESVEALPRYRSFGFEIGDRNHEKRRKDRETGS